MKLRFNSKRFKTGLSWMIPIKIWKTLADVYESKTLGVLFIVAFTTLIIQVGVLLFLPFIIVGLLLSSIEVE